MSKVTYFQRYQTRENWMTNTTMLLLSRLCDHDRSAFARVMNALIGGPDGLIQVAPKFTQQDRGMSSVPDGKIQQVGYHIILEVKLSAVLDLTQLENHLQTFDDPKKQSSVNVLLGLITDTDHSRIQETRRSIQSVIAEKADTIGRCFFNIITYDKLISTIRSELADLDYQFHAIIDDYEELCDSEGLTNLHKNTVIAFAARETIPYNRKYGVYYCKATNSFSRRFSFIALYDRRCVVAIGKLQPGGIVACDLKEGELVDETGCKIDRLSDVDRKRIIDAMNDAPYDNLKFGHQFMLVDEFHETSVQKSIAIRSMQYLQLDSFLDRDVSELSAKEIAHLLNGMKWD